MNETYKGNVGVHDASIMADCCCKQRKDWKPSVLEMFHDPI